MTIRDPKSIIIISFYALINATIITLAFNQEFKGDKASKKKAKAPPAVTEVVNLDYFHMKAGVPQLSINATKMTSHGEARAKFTKPKGVYNYQQKQKTMRYEGNQGTYLKKQELLELAGDVKITSEEANYSADNLKYFFKRDFMQGHGNVHFTGVDPKTRDNFDIKSNAVSAYPQQQHSTFTGNVRGHLQRKKKYEGKMAFSSQQLQMEGLKSLAHLEGDVRMNRETYLITAGKADIFLENFNKSLKYFVFNDDVKVTETVKTPQGTTQRKAFAERLEGFNQEQKMVLSGAPRVEQGTDVIKGYRITIRENVDLIEVDDAMSDVQVKREDKVKKDKDVK